ncbi:hypothetical protein B9Q04_15020 [Candidatus Marsarchaeota G2 archaeon BE_D]|uniref:Uncharacterized protein n=1 Tax=Candidatus Marsarchaeota G2 archaeon BE_D TaxID=1978158 RepID=A0A2R6C6V9_9ARCH|nr:MAG: hypothetical protein B9Q04_15020 [Candidatus Marsarchaeota G2 archaeon BE_D]
MIEYSRGFRSKLSYTSTLLAHSSTLDFERGSESTLKKPEVFLRLKPKALSSTANKTLSSEEPPPCSPQKHSNPKRIQRHLWVVGATAGATGFSRMVPTS